MRLFIRKVCLFGVYILIFAIIISVLIDPYNIFHKSNIRNNGVEPNSNYIKMNYILNHPKKYNSLVFGSSRVGALHTEKMENEICYNMTYSCGVPSEHFANLKTLISDGVVLDKVYIGVDSLSCAINEESHFNEPLRCPYEYSQDHPFRFYSMYLNPQMAFESLNATIEYAMKKNKNMDAIYSGMYKYGWAIEYNRKSDFDWASIQTSGDISAIEQPLMENTLEDISEIVKLCYDNNIELVVFTNPMFKTTYEASVKGGYLVFLKELAEITPFYNFSGINRITLDTSNYIDNSHYNAEVGDMLIECMCNEKKYAGLYEYGFGKYVTKENVDEFLDIIE